MKQHNLKTDIAVFQAVFDELKTYEIRYNDRDFQIGDVLVLLETTWSGEEIRNGKPIEFTGRRLVRTVSHVLTGYGLMDGWCILSFVGGNK